MNQGIERPSSRRRGCLRWGLIAAAVLFGLCVLTASISAISNTRLPELPAETANLTAIDTARIEEAYHLKATVGEAVWPGWGDVAIPILVWNADYAFLTGYEGDLPGWEMLPGEGLAAYPVYRQAGSEHWQAFSQQVTSDVYAGALATKVLIDLDFIDNFQTLFPPPIRGIVPYRLLIMPTEKYVAGVLHETFHAYQQTTAPDRFADAEDAYPLSGAYEAAEDSMQDGWRIEVNLLVKALNAGTVEEARDLAGQFLDARADRRAGADLSGDLILYEQRFEWLEGLAKYIELGVWEAGANASGYQPVAGLADDPDFQQYGTFQRNWSSELLTMRNMANQAGDQRLYYSGMAQARLLDRLMPGWKDRVMQEGVWLEDLLAEAVGR